MNHPSTPPPVLHPAMAAWPGLMGRLAQRLKERGTHPARTLVLLPFAQLMPVATRQWAACHPDGFAPRFETTRNWARQLAPFSPGPDDLSFDPARDLPLAQNLLERAGLGAQRDVLAGALMESATQLAALAAAHAPDERLAWAAAMTPVVAGAETGPLAFEAAVARLALVWAATSAQATDVLYGPLARDAVDAIFVLQGFQPDPLTSALAARWGERVEVLTLPPDAPRGEVRLFPAVDAEDEAERAAARVLAHIEAGRVPVALAATDRALTRRVRALLGARGVAIRDENGWKLSTTRVAAQLMALLRALAWNASSDDVLDALKNMPAWGDAPSRLALEAWLRRQGLRDWRDVERLCTPDSLDAKAAALAPRVADVAAARARFGSPRPLAAWLVDLRALLHTTGLAAPMALDAAGARLLAVLRLEEGAAGGICRRARRRPSPFPERVHQLGGCGARSRQPRAAAPGARAGHHPAAEPDAGAPLCRAGAARLRRRAPARRSRAARSLDGHAALGAGAAEPGRTRRRPARRLGLCIAGARLRHPLAPGRRQRRAAAALARWCRPCCSKAWRARRMTRAPRAN
jgi:ATP-dependent helicase/nuclease subunit B